MEQTWSDNQTSTERPRAPDPERRDDEEVTAQGHLQGGAGGAAQMTGPARRHGGALTPAGVAVDAATRAVPDTREACLGAESAVERAAGLLAGSDNPLPRLTLAHWDSALAQAWAALSLVYGGLGEARTLPGVRPASIEDVLTSLRAARREADHAAANTVMARQRLGAAEDLLRRCDTSARARLAADRWRAAVARLDLVTARLEIGARSIDHYIDVLDGSADNGGPGTAGGPELARSSRTTPVTVPDLAAGAVAAGAAVRSRHPWGGWRGFWAQARNEQRRENQRRWRKLQRLF